jgi:hypothetical protein
VHDAYIRLVEQHVAGDSGSVHGHCCDGDPASSSRSWSQAAVRKTRSQQRLLDEDSLLLLAGVSS